MDELLGSETGAPLDSAGPASAQVARSVASRQIGQSFLAGVFWWLFTYSESYYDAVRRLRASKEARPIVVCHADGTRFDLLLLDPDRQDDWAAVQLQGNGLDTDFLFSRGPRERLSNLLRRTELGGALDSRTLLNSALELAASSQFGVAAVTAPPEIQTCAISPAVSLQSMDSAVVATLGTFLTNMEAMPVDTCLATTADHALAGDSGSYTINGVQLDVLRRHAPSDSCLVRVSKSILDGRQQSGLRGPLRITPALYRPVSFDGAASGPTATRLTGYDPAIVDPQPDEMCRVYTEPDTAKGDSGAALIDENDYILGFAWRLSRYNSPIQFSSWVWAEQVYMAHDLFVQLTLGA